MTIQIKMSDHDLWRDCRIDYIAFASATYIRFSNGTQRVTIYGTLDEIRAMLRSLGQNAFHPPADRWNNQRATNVLEMTPQDVIDYFRASPTLAYLTDEVEQVLRDIDETTSQSASDLDTVLKTLGPGALLTDNALVWGAQAKIAKVLGIPNAGAYRKRILAVVRQLEAKFTTTTTGKAA